MNTTSLTSIVLITLTLVANQVLAGELSQDHVAIDANLLTRDSGDNVVYLYDNNGTVNSSPDDIPIANTGSFSEQADVGYRISAGKNLTQRWSIQAGFLSSDFNQTDSFSNPARQLEIFRLPLTDNLDAADYVSAYYSSELQILELNVVYRLNDMFDFFAGINQVTLDESFNIVSDDSLAAGVGTYNISTKNDMLGPQVGFAFNYKPADSYGFYIIGKLAWLDNDADQNQVVDDSPAFTRSNSASDSHSSTMYDIRLGVNYYFSKQFSMNLGYQLIDISDVALAESQFDTTAAGSNTVNTSDSISWDGFNLGISYMF